MSTLWIVNHYAGDPRKSAGGTRHFSLGRELTKLGWDVAVIAASTDHPSGRRPGGMGLWRDAAIERVTFRWLWAPRYEGNGLLRVLNMVAFPLLLLLPGVTSGLRRPDAIVGSTVHPLAAWAGYRMARRYKVPFVFEIRDLWPETLVQMGALKPGHPVERLLRLLEAHLCTRAAAIVTTMPLAVDYLESRGVPRSKVHWISNGVELDRFPVLESRPLDGRVRVTYFGSMGNANALEILLKGFGRAAVRDSRLELHLYGDGPLRASLEALASTLGLGESVVFHGPVPKAQLPRVAADSDLLVAALLPLPLYRYGISLNKLFEYLAAERPIVFGGQVSGGTLDGAHGVLLVGADADEIADGILSIAESSRLDRVEMGKANRCFAVDRYSYGVLATRYSGLLSSIMQD